MDRRPVNGMLPLLLQEPCDCFPPLQQPQPQHEVGCESINTYPESPRHETHSKGFVRLFRLMSAAQLVVGTLVSSGRQADMF